MVYVTIGISGSGKTTYGKYYEGPNCKVVCMDDIRKELTGNISDQSKNAEVFTEAMDQISDAIFCGKDVYHSATNLKLYGIKDLIRRITNYEHSEDKVPKITFLVFDDSLTPSLCRRRVQKDLANNVDRSNTLTKVDDVNDIIAKQAADFMKLYSNPEFWALGSLEGIKIEEV